MIYFLHCERDSDDLYLQAGWIKIGTTTRLSARLKQIAADIGHTPTVLAVLDGAFAEEHALHERFGFAKMRGEWFYPGPELLQLIETEGRPWDGSDEVPLAYGTTKIDRLLLGKAHLIAKSRGVPVAELLSEMVRGQIEKAYGQLLRDLDKQEGKV